MLNTKLILVEGLPGAGKSTTTAYLHTVLQPVTTSESRLWQHTAMVMTMSDCVFFHLIHRQRPGVSPSQLSVAVQLLLANSFLCF